MIRTMTLAALMAAALPMIAAAQGNGNGNGNGNPHGAGQQGQFCPPGLANRNPPCVPPGQAARHDDHGDDHDDDHDDDGIIGAIIDADRIHWIADWPDRDLAPLEDGYGYALVDNQLVIIDRQTLALVDLVQLID
jgi:hypothetical protein